MSLRSGLPTAVVAGVSFLMASAATPQTLVAPAPTVAAPASPITAPIGGTSMVVNSADVPAVAVGPGPDAAPSPDAAAAALTPAVTLDDRVAREGADVAALDPELECMAKVVHHEAANQSLKGQLAVAQLILNRVKSPLFPKSICAVVNQRGQFFHTARYFVPASSPRWHVAVGIARVARADDMPPVAPGALFYHASFARPSWSHRRVLVARIGGNVFYR